MAHTHHTDTSSRRSCCTKNPSNFIALASDICWTFATPQTAGGQCLQRLIYRKVHTCSPTSRTSPCHYQRVEMLLLLVRTAASRWARWQCKQRIYLAGPRLSFHLPTKKRLRSRMMCLANAIVVHAIAVSHARMWLHLPMHSFAVAEARRP